MQKDYLVFTTNGSLSLGQRMWVNIDFTEQFLEENSSYTLNYLRKLLKVQYQWIISD